MSKTRKCQFKKCSIYALLFVVSYCCLSWIYQEDIIISFGYYKNDDTVNKEQVFGRYHLANQEKDNKRKRRGAVSSRNRDNWRN